jgi:hypothetical protein
MIGKYPSHDLAMMVASDMIGRGTEKVIHYPPSENGVHVLFRQTMDSEDTP